MADSKKDQRKKIDPLIPFILPAGLRAGVMARGELVQVTQVATNTDFLITVRFGRVPVLVIPLWNGTTYVPKVRQSSVTAPTLNQITVQVDTTCPAPGAWFWVL